VRAASIIEADSSTPITRPSGHALVAAAGEAARAAARVEHRLVAAQFEAVHHLAPSRSIGVDSRS
jgi:hypothetical protein